MRLSSSISGTSASSGSSSSSPSNSFCFVDDLSVRSEGRCLLKLHIYDGGNEGGSLSHVRVIHPHQIADKEHQGRLSYPLLVELIEKSSASFVHGTTPTSSAPCMTIWCTYKDQNDHNVLIATTEELQYAMVGMEDTLNLHVQIVHHGDVDKAREKEKDNKPEPPTLAVPVLQESHLIAMEDRLNQNLSAKLDTMQIKLDEKLDTMAHNLKMEIKLDQKLEAMVTVQSAKEKNKKKNQDKDKDKDNNTIPKQEQTAVEGNLLHLDQLPRTTQNNLLLPSAEEIVVPAAATIPSMQQQQEQAINLMEQGILPAPTTATATATATCPCTASQAINLMEQGLMMAPTTASACHSATDTDADADAATLALCVAKATGTEIATTAELVVPTAECHWVQPNTNTNTNTNTMTTCSNNSNDDDVNGNNNNNGNNNTTDPEEEVVHPNSSTGTTDAVYHESNATIDRMDELDATSEQPPDRSTDDDDDDDDDDHSDVGHEDTTNPPTTTAPSAGFHESNASIDRINELLLDQDTPAAATNATTNNTATTTTLAAAGLHESNATIDRLDELEVTSEDLISNSVVPLLKTTIKRMSHYNEKRIKGLNTLREDMEARASQMEEWNKTILDGISAQSKLLKNRMNDRTEKIVRRISQLEACCSDLSKQNNKKTSSTAPTAVTTAAVGPSAADFEKQQKALERIEAEQVSLRQDIKVLIKAIVKEADKKKKNKKEEKDDDEEEEEEEDDGWEESSSSSSSSNSSSLSESSESSSDEESVYTSSNVPATVSTTAATATTTTPATAKTLIIDDRSIDDGSLYDFDEIEEEGTLHRKDQRLIWKLRGQMAFHESSGNKKEVERLNEQIASIWAGVQPLATEEEQEHLLLPQKPSWKMKKAFEAPHSPTESMILYGSSCSSSSNSDKATKKAAAAGAAVQVKAPRKSRFGWTNTKDSLILYGFRDDDDDDYHENENIDTKKPETTTSLWEEEKKKTSGTRQKGQQQQGRASAGFLQLKVKIVDRLKSIYQSLKDMKEKERSGFGSENAKQIIKLKAEVREELRQALKDWETLDEIYKKEAWKRQSKFSGEELEVQEELLQRLYSEIEKVEEAQAAGYARGQCEITSTDRSNKKRGVALTDDQEQQLLQIEERDAYLDRQLDEIGEGIQELEEFKLEELEQESIVTTTTTKTGTSSSRRRRHSDKRQSHSSVHGLHRRVPRSVHFES